MCQASGGAPGGQTSLGQGEGAFLLLEPAGRGFPEAQGGLASSLRGEPPALPAWQEGARQQQLCVPALLGTPLLGTPRLPVLAPPPGLPPPRPRGLPSGTFSCPQLVRLALSRELLPRDVGESRPAHSPLSRRGVSGPRGAGQRRHAGVCVCRLQRNTLTRFMCVNNGLDLFTDQSNHFRLAP